MAQGVSAWEGGGGRGRFTGRGSLHGGSCSQKAERAFIHSVITQRTEKPLGKDEVGESVSRGNGRKRN